MEGRLEKRVKRAFGQHTWTWRSVRLTGSDLEVDGKDGVKIYALDHLVLKSEGLPASSKKKLAFALCEGADALITLCATVSEHALWVQEIKSTQKRRSDKKKQGGGRRRTAAFSADDSDEDESDQVLRTKREQAVLDAIDKELLERSQSADRLNFELTLVEEEEEEQEEEAPPPLPPPAVVVKEEAPAPLPAVVVKETPKRRELSPPRRQLAALGIKETMKKRELQLPPARRSLAALRDATAKLNTAAVKEAEKAVVKAEETPPPPRASPPLRDEQPPLANHHQEAAATPSQPQQGGRPCFERFELVYRTGPFGIELDTATNPLKERRIAIVDVKPYGENADQLRVGDEIVGYKAPSTEVCCFFEDEDEIERGGLGVYTIDDAYELLAEISESRIFPTKLLLRRRIVEGEDTALPVVEKKQEEVKEQEQQLAQQQAQQRAQQQEQQLAQQREQELAQEQAQQLAQQQQQNAAPPVVEKKQEEVKEAPPVVAVVVEKKQEEAPLVVVEEKKDPLTLKLAKYLRMSKCGVPSNAVLRKAQIEGELEKFELDALRERLDENVAPITTPKEEAPAESSSLVEKYLKIVKRGVPAAAVMQKAKVDESLTSADLEELTRRLGSKLNNTPELTPKKFGGGGAPKSACKGVHWTVKSETKRSSLWNKTSRRNKRESLGARADELFEGDCEAGKLLEELFSTTPVAEKVVKKQAKKEQRLSSVKKEVELLEHGRALSLQVALSSMRNVEAWPPRGPKEAGLIRALIAHAVDVTQPDALQSLASAIPPADVLADMLEKSNDSERYTRSTLFALAAARFPARPAVKALLTTLAASQEAVAEAVAARASSLAVHEVCVSVRESRELRAALRAALALGNRLNAGTQREKARAVSVIELERLAHTKSRDGTMTPFDVLAAALQIDRGKGGLDAAGIDAAIRIVRAKIQAARLDAHHERTFEAARRIEARRTNLFGLASAAAAFDSSKSELVVEKLNVDDEASLNALALALFASRSRKHIAPPIDAALKPLHAALEDLQVEETALREHCNESDDVPIHAILAALASFCTALIDARVRLLERNKKQQLAKKA